MKPHPCPSTTPEKKKVVSDAQAIHFKKTLLKEVLGRTRAKTGLKLCYSSQSFRFRKVHPKGVIVDNEYIDCLV
jgi:hypothetical protein